jgi:hypothetical protein
MPCILIAETHREWGTKNQIFTVGFFYSLPDGIKAGFFYFPRERGLYRTEGEA